MHFWTFWCCCFRQNAKPRAKNWKNAWENPMETRLTPRFVGTLQQVFRWTSLGPRLCFKGSWKHGFLQVLEPGWLEVNLDFAEYLEAELEDGNRDTVLLMEMSIWMYWQVQYLLNVATEASLEQVSLEAKCWVKTVEFHFLPLFEAKTFRHKSRRNIQRVILRDFYVVFCALVKPDVFVVSLTSSHAELPGLVCWALQQAFCDLCFLVDSNLGKLKITRFSANSAVESNDASVTLLWMKLRVIDSKNHRPQGRKIWWDAKEPCSNKLHWYHDLQTSPRKNVNHDSICLGTCARFAVWETW